MNEKVYSTIRVLPSTHILQYLFFQAIFKMKLSSVASILALFGLSSAAALSNIHTDYYTENLPAANISEKENLWAGAMLDKEAYDGVSAKLIVPAPKVPSGGNDSATNCMTMWLGIGGTCNRMLQGGITACVQDGKPIYRTWLARNPDWSTGLAEIKEGDEIRIVVITIGKDKGYVQVENLTTGKKQGANVALQYYPLCQNKVLWMVQPYTSGYPFAEFGTVGFTDAYASLGQKTFNITDATLFEIKEDNKELTKSKYTDNTVTIEYIE